MNNDRKFERLLKLEDAAKGWKLQAQLGMFPWDRENGRAQHAKVSAELFAAITALSPAEAAAFGEYRKTAQEVA